MLLSVRLQLYILFLLLLSGTVAAQQDPPQLYNLGNAEIKDLVGIVKLSSADFIVGANVDYGNYNVKPTLFHIGENGEFIEANNFWEVGFGYDYWQMTDITSVGNNVFMIGTLEISQADHNPPYIAKSDGTSTAFFEELEETYYGYDVTLQGIAPGEDRVIVFGNLDGSYGFFMELNTSGVNIGSRYINYQKIVGATYAKDGSIYLAASDANNYLYIIKMNSTYTVQWAKQLSTYTIYSEENVKVHLKEASNGSIIVAAQLNGYGTSSTEKNVLCASLDNATGNRDWAKIVGDISGNSDDDILKSLETNSTGVHLGIETSNYGFGKTDFKIVNINNTGTYLGSYSFGGLNDEKDCDMVWALDDIFMLAGKTQSFDVSKPTLFTHYMDTQYETDYQIPVYSNIIPLYFTPATVAVTVYGNYMDEIDYDHDGGGVLASTFSAYLPESTTFISNISSSSPITNVSALNQSSGLITATAAVVDGNTNHYFSKYSNNGDVEWSKTLIQTGTNYSDEYDYDLIELYSKKLFLRKRFTSTSLVFTNKSLEIQSEYYLSGLGNNSYFGVHNYTKNNQWSDNIVLSGTLDGSPDKIFVCDITSAGSAYGYTFDGTISSKSIGVVRKSYNNTVVYAQYDANYYYLVDYTNTTTNRAKRIDPAYAWSNEILLPAKDGNVYLIHNLSAGTEIYKVYLTSSNTIALKKYIAGFMVTEAKMSNDGYLLLAGFKNNSPFVLKLDSDGNAVWGKEYVSLFYTQSNNLDLSLSSEGKNGFSLVVSGTKDSKNYITTISADKEGNVNSGCHVKDATFSVVTSPYTSATITNIAVVMSSWSPSVSAKTDYSNSNTNFNYTQSPMDLVTDVSSTNTSCNGFSDGAAQVSIVEGTSPIQVLWSNGSSGNSLSNVSAGTYVATITDVYGCEQTETVSITEPPLLAFTVDKTDVTCHGGTNGKAEALAVGGTAPYYYNWSNGLRSSAIGNLYAGNLFVNVTDNNGCGAALQQITINQPGELAVSLSIAQEISCNGANEGEINAIVSGGTAPYTFIWSNGSEKEGVVAVFAGTYTVTVVDICGIEAVASTTLTEPSALAFNHAVINVSCNGGSDGEIAITPTGGVGPFEYSWDFGNSNPTVSGLQKGVYTISVKDQCDLLKRDITITEPQVLSATISKTDATCFGNGDATATITPVGGTTPYSYSWNTGQNTQMALGLFKGNYSANVIDANGCITTNSITIEQPEPLEYTVHAESISCYGENTGSAYITINGGVAPFEYAWSNGDLTESISELPVGTYTVTVADACNEILVQDFNIDQPKKLVTGEYIQNVRCNGQSNGSVLISMLYGVEPYLIEWSNGADTTYLDNLSAQTLSYFVYDACRDTVFDTLSITEPPLMIVKTTTTDPSCFGYGNGTASLEVEGGIAPYFYYWNIGLQTPGVNGLFPGSYNVNVFDANACLASEFITIGEPEALSVEMSVVNTECGADIGAITAVADGGTGAYSYAWSTGNATAMVSQLAKGKYSVTVSDENNCQLEKNATVGVSVTSYPICMLTVDKGTGKNKVVWEKNNNSTIESVNVYRMAGGSFQFMGNVENSENSYYDDEISNPQITAARYAITCEDACNNESELSAYHQTIHLGSSKGSDGSSVVLDWTEYIDESGAFTPQWYYLYRGTKQSNLQLFDSVDAQVSTEYNDIAPEGAIYYRVAVNKKEQCVATGLKSDSGPYSQSLSNIAEAQALTSDGTVGDLAFSLYPNPSNGKFFIAFKNFDQAHVTITNIAGQTVWKSTMTSNRAEIDISDEVAGIYTLLVESKGIQAFTKIILEK